MTAHIPQAGPMPVGGPTLPTWGELIEREPRLGDLLAGVRAGRDDGPVFCRHAVRYGYWGYPGIARRLARLTGWLAQRPDPTLRSQAAHDLAVEVLAAPLPPCRGCSCRLWSKAGNGP